MIIVAGGLPPPRTTPVYSAFGLVVDDMVAGGPLEKNEKNEKKEELKMKK